MGLVRRLWRPTTRPSINYLYRLFFLVILIITPSILLGLIDGLLFSIHTHTSQLEARSLRVRNVVSAKLTPASHRPRPFHVPAILDPTNWWESLGLTRISSGSRLDKSSSGLATLYRDDYSSSQCEDPPWHHWVYISAQRLFSNTSEVWDEWDTAFDTLIQHHYANPAANDAGFSVLACPESFVCREWLGRGPALLHLTTDPTTREALPGSIHGPPMRWYKPVIARFFEFPRPAEQLNSLYRPRQKVEDFPSPYKQLLAYTGSRDAWMTGYPHNPMTRGLQVVHFISREAQDAYPLTYGRLRRLNSWIDDQLERLGKYHLQVGPGKLDARMVSDMVYFLALTFSLPVYDTTEGIFIRERRRIRGRLGYETNDAGREMYEALVDETRLVRMRGHNPSRRELDNLVRALGLDQRPADTTPEEVGDEGLL